MKLETSTIDSSPRATVNAHQFRSIQTFVRREGRITASQRQALATLLPHYAPPSGVLDWAALFGREAPVTLEIGFGNGEALLAMAQAQPERDFIGIEVYRPGIGHLLHELARAELTNVRVIEGDAVAVIRNRVPANSLARIQIFFPDPWPKKRHHKRRLIQPGFVELLTDKLQPSGQLHLATDWEPYALSMHEVLQAAPCLTNLGDASGFAERGMRPLTKFEQRGAQRGHQVRDLLYECSTKRGLRGDP